MSTTILAETSAISVKRRRSTVLFLAKLLVAAGLLTWLFWSGRLDFSSLLKIRHSKYIWLAGGMLLLSMVLPVWRWLWLLRIQQLKVGWLTALGMTWLGYFAAIFLPGAAGGDLAKAYAACQHQSNAKTRAVSTVLLDRVLGLHSMLVFGSAAGLVLLIGRCERRVAGVAWFPILLMVAMSAGLLLLFWKPYSNLMLKVLPRRFRGSFEGSLSMYCASWRQVGWIWGFSLLCNATSVGAYKFAATAIGMELTTTQVFAVIPLVIIANCVPIAPSGLGVGESVASALFAIFGMTQGALLVLLVRMGGVALAVPGVLALLHRPSAQPRAEAGTENQKNPVRPT